MKNNIANRNQKIIFTSLLFFSILAPIFCQANAGSVATFAFAGGIAFLAAQAFIIPIEALVIRKLLPAGGGAYQYSFLNIFSFSFIANAATSIIGFPFLYLFLLFWTSVLERYQYFGASDSLFLVILIMAIYLVASFLLSLWIETMIACRYYFKNINKSEVKRAVFFANFATYAALVLFFVFLVSR